MTFGELGNSTSGSSAYGPAPVTVCASAGCSSTFTGATAIARADSTSCAVAGGAAYCRGDDNVGEVGVGSTTTASYTGVVTPVTTPTAQSW